MDASERSVRRLAQDLLQRAKRLDAEIVGAGFRRLMPPVPQPPSVDPLMEYDLLVTDADLRAATRALFRDGHYARSVEEAYKFLNHAVKGRAGADGMDGQALMLHAFGDNPVVLRLNQMRSMSEKDEQAGYRFIYAGAMRGIRNPRAHEPDLRDDASTAIEMLVMANHLVRMLRRTTRARPRRAAGVARQP